MKIAKLKPRKVRVPGVRPIKSTLTKKQAQAELERLAREQNVELRPGNALRVQFPELADPKLWEGFDEFLRELRCEDKRNGRS